MAVEAPKSSPATAYGRWQGHSNGPRSEYSRWPQPAAHSTWTSSFYVIPEVSKATSGCLQAPCSKARGTPDSLRQRRKQQITHVLSLRDNWSYRAANGRTQAVDTAAFVGLAPPAKTSQETVANTHASRECPCLPLTGSPTAAASVGNESIGFRCYGIQTTPLEWNG